MKAKPFCLGIVALGLALVACNGGGASSSSGENTPSSSSKPEETSSDTGSSSTTDTEQPSEEETKLDEWRQQYKLKTVAELCEIAASQTSKPTADSPRYYVAATVKSIDNPKYGGMTIEDETGEMMVYGTYGADGEKRYPDLEQKPVANDLVLLYGNLQNYNGTMEIYSGWIIDFVHREVEIDPDDYELITIAESRALDKGETCRVKGTALRHTFNTSLNEIGFLLADSTGMIYVYDSQIAPQVDDGEVVELVATRDNWILDDEASYAEKFGYNGAIQLVSAVLLSHQQGEGFDYASSAKKTTVKKLLSADFDEPITGDLYQVAALIQKRQGDDFVNYYIFDLDGKTGTYSYTQASGADFAWLDQYDGKIVTLYMTVLNAKMSASGGNWRVSPVYVDPTPYSYDPSYTPELAVEYYGIGQFSARYGADPALKVNTSIDNDLVGVKGATLSYSSSNEEAAYFSSESGATVFHVDPTHPGKVTITITGSYGDYENYVGSVEIEVFDPENVGISVQEAIEAEADPTTTLLVRGIVGPSLVNQSGFYLIDESGVIAVKLSSFDLFDGTFHIGDEVVIEGYRDYYGSKGAQSQICITDAYIYVNLYGGDGTYPTDSFITGKTIAELVSLPVSELEHTAEVYVIDKASLTVNDGYYPTYYLIDEGEKDYGSKGLQFYQSGSAQYAWLQSYLGQTFKAEIALCNWNSKSAFKVCVLSITLEDGTQIYNQLNFGSAE